MGLDDSMCAGYPHKEGGQMTHHPGEELTLTQLLNDLEDLPRGDDREKARKAVEDRIESMVSLAREEERERCATIVQSHLLPFSAHYVSGLVYEMDARVALSKAILLPPKTEE